MAGTDPVAAVSMGASPASTDFQFFADRRNNHVRRVGTLLRRVYARGFSFPDSDLCPWHCRGLWGPGFR